MTVDGQIALSTKYLVCCRVHFVSLNVTSRLTHGNFECQRAITRKG